MISYFKLNIFYSMLIINFWATTNLKAQSDADYGLVIEGGTEPQNSIRYQVLTLQFEQIADIYTVALWILIASLLKSS